MPNKVIVIPETEEFTHHVAIGELYVKNSIAPSNLDGIEYAAPYLLNGNSEGVRYVYKVVKAERSGEDLTVFFLGDSKQVPKIWDKMKQKRKFQYQELKDFGLEPF